jgi:hypothetical protein
VRFFLRGARFFTKKLKKVVDKKIKRGSLYIYQKGGLMVIYILFSMTCSGIVTTIIGITTGLHAGWLGFIFYLLTVVIYLFGAVKRARREDLVRGEWIGK